MSAAEIQNSGTLKVRLPTKTAPELTCGLQLLLKIFLMLRERALSMGSTFHEC